MRVCVRALMVTASLFVLLFAINNFYHIFACRNFLILPPLTAIPFCSFVVWTNLSISECPAWTTVLSSAVRSALCESVANDFRTLIKFIVREMTVFMGCLVCVQIYHLWSLYAVVYYYILLLLWLFKEVRMRETQVRVVTRHAHFFLLEPMPMCWMRLSKVFIVIVGDKYWQWCEPSLGTYFGQRTLISALHFPIKHSSSD